LRGTDPRPQTSDLRPQTSDLADKIKAQFGEHVAGVRPSQPCGTPSPGCDRADRPSVRQAGQASNGRYGATYATESGALARGTKPHEKAKITEVGRERKVATCRSCRTQLSLDDTGNANRRLAALFVLSITLGLRPGEL
jgi:hypothetical protein